MKRFALLFRMDIVSAATQPSNKLMGVYAEQWMDWISSISAKCQLAGGGEHFSNEGVVIKSGNKTVNAPFFSNRVSVAGYLLIYADSFKDASTIAEQCPILSTENASVEIRALGITKEQSQEIIHDYFY